MNITQSHVPTDHREQVEQAVKKKNGKAVGKDEIEMLKNGGEVMIDWLLEILQEVWRMKQLQVIGILVLLLRKKTGRYATTTVAYHYSS